MIITPRTWPAYDVPEDESCEICAEACEHNCSKRPLQTWFIVLTLWATAITSLLYLSAKQKQNSGRHPIRCPSPLDQPDDINAEIVLNYPLGDSVQYLPALGLANKEYSYSPNYSPPVLVTVASQKLFPTTVRLIQNLRKEMMRKFPQMKLVIFDMDLTAAQHGIIEDDCECEVRRFPYEMVPDFIQNHVEVWQPLTIQVLLKDYNFVVWIDPATKSIPSKETLKKAISMASKTGIAMFYTEKTGQTPLAEAVDPKTLQALGEVQCAFEGVHKFNSSLLLIYDDNSGYVTRYIMRPWLSCALTKDCMASESDSEMCSPTSNSCNDKSTNVLSIVLHRLYYNDFRNHGTYPFEIS